MLYVPGNIDTYQAGSRGPDIVFLNNNAATVHSQFLNTSVDQQMFATTFASGGYYSAKPIGSVGHRAEQQLVRDGVTDQRRSRPGTGLAEFATGFRTGCWSESVDLDACAAGREFSGHGELYAWAV